MANIIAGGLKLFGTRYTVRPSFPVGSVYISMIDINPDNEFGGTWQRIAKGQMLIGVNENDPDFNAPWKIGGEKKHTLNIDETPAHQHGIRNDGGAHTGSFAGAQFTWGIPQANLDKNACESIGGNQPHNNMPPYLTCYMYYRVS